MNESSSLTNKVKQGRVCSDCLHALQMRLMAGDYGLHGSCLDVVSKGVGD